MRKGGNNTEKDLITVTTEGTRRRGRSARAWISDITGWSDRPMLEMLIRTVIDHITRRKIDHHAANARNSE